MIGDDHVGPWGPGFFGLVVGTGNCEACASAVASGLKVAFIRIFVLLLSYIMFMQLWWRYGVVQSSCRCDETCRAAGGIC